MNKKHLKTFNKIFTRPTRSDITWKEVESLFTALNAEIKKGKGSRIRIIMEKHVLNIHTPHPQKELRKYAVDLLREFLTTTNAGVQ